MVKGEALARKQVSKKMGNTPIFGTTSMMEGKTSTRRMVDGEASTQRKNSKKFIV